MVLDIAPPRSPPRSSRSSSVNGHYPTNGFASNTINGYNSVNGSRAPSRQSSINLCNGELRQNPHEGWIIQKFGGTSVGKYATQIAEDIVRWVNTQLRKQKNPSALLCGMLTN